MAKRSKAKKSGSGLDLDGFLRPEFLGILLLLLALLTLLSLVPVERGAAMEGWIVLLERGFGWGAWLMPVWFAAVGLWLVFVGLEREMYIRPEKAWGALFLFVFGLALLHLLHQLG